MRCASCLLAAAASLVMLTGCAPKRGSVIEQVCPTTPPPPAKPVAAMQAVTIPPPIPLAGKPESEQAVVAVADYVTCTGALGEANDRIIELTDWINRR